MRSCGHICCPSRRDPRHEHFLGPPDCPACFALRLAEVPGVGRLRTVKR